MKNIEIYSIIIILIISLILIFIYYKVLNFYPINIIIIKCLSWIYEISSFIINPMVNKKNLTYENMFENQPFHFSNSTSFIKAYIDIDLMNECHIDHYKHMIHMLNSLDCIIIYNHIEIITKSIIISKQNNFYNLLLYDFHKYVVKHNTLIETTVYEIFKKKLKKFNTQMYNMQLEKQYWGVKTK